jgi:hypothetical protein
MGDAAIFFWFFAGLFVLRIIAATFVYAWLLSEAPECPACGGETLHIERRGIAWLFPRLRPSWCPECAWEGMLKPVPTRECPAAHSRPVSTNTDSHSGQLPLISKKSSK